MFISFPFKRINTSPAHVELLALCLEPKTHAVSGVACRGASGNFQKLWNTQIGRLLDEHDVDQEQVGLKDLKMGIL